MGERINHTFAENLGFRPQGETFQSFMAGKAPDEFRTLRMSANGRTELWHLHESGYQNRKLKVLFIGAHPDDTALSEGFEHLLVKKGEKGEKKETGLAVISLTPGDANGDSEVRLGEDISATRHLGADIYINLGFSDGRLPQEKEHLNIRLAHYLHELRPDIVIIPDPEDKSHEDHVMAAEATIEGLRNNQQRPIVIYMDHQFGDKEITDGTVGFTLEPPEYGVFEAAFKAHDSQTNPPSPDVQRVLARPREHAEKYTRGDSNYLGIARQELDLGFSEEPIRNHLGDRYTELKKHVPLSPFVIFDSARREASIII